MAEPLEPEAQQSYRPDDISPRFLKEIAEPLEPEAQQSYRPRRHISEVPQGNGWATRAWSPTKLHARTTYLRGSSRKLLSGYIVLRECCIHTPSHLWRTFLNVLASSCSLRTSTICRPKSTLRPVSLQMIICCTTTSRRTRTQSLYKMTSTS